MLDDYFVGSVNQLIERARLLRAKMPRNLPRDYDTLDRTCSDRLNDILRRLRTLLDSPQFKLAEFRAERLRSFKRIVADMDIIETVCIAALDRAKQADHSMNVLMEKISREIRYPLVTPVITTLSQQYFHIYPELGLLCVPLAEGDFLLHLPDLYHELAHPLLTARDDLVIEPFQHAFSEALHAVLTYLQDEMAKESRRWGPVEPRFLLERWEVAWVKYWLVEFFCDLFAIYTLGPAFAWSHLHLCAKRGEDPYDVVMHSTSHPADDARMSVMLHAMCLSGFAAEAADVRTRWAELIAESNARPEPEFRRCYPDRLLQQITEKGFAGVRKMGCRVAMPDTVDPIHTLLNQAWQVFWRDPAAFTAWERDAVTKLWTPSDTVSRQTAQVDEGISASLS